MVATSLFLYFLFFSFYKLKFNYYFFFFFLFTLKTNTMIELCVCDVYGCVETLWGCCTDWRVPRVTWNVFSRTLMRLSFYLAWETLTSLPYPTPPFRSSPFPRPFSALLPQETPDTQKKIRRRRFAGSKREKNKKKKVFPSFSQ